MANLGPTITLVDRFGTPLDSGSAFPLNVIPQLGNGNAITGPNPVPVAEELAGVQVSNSTTLAGAASGSVTLPGVANKTTYIRGFIISSINAAATVSGLVTLTGTISGTLNFEYVQLTTGGLLVFTPGTGIAASAVNTPIVLNFPAITSGSATALTIWGIQL